MVCKNLKALKYADFGALENIILPCRPVCSLESKQSTRTFSRIRRIILWWIIFQQYFNFSIIWYHPGLLFLLYITLFKPGCNWGILNRGFHPESARLSNPNHYLWLDWEACWVNANKCWRSRKFLFNRYFVLYQYPSRLHWGEILINIKITSKILQLFFVNISNISNFGNYFLVQDEDPSWWKISQDLFSKDKWNSFYYS